MQNDPELNITPAALRRHRVTVFRALPPHLDARTPLQQADAAAWRLVRRSLTVGFERDLAGIRGGKP